MKALELFNELPNLYQCLVTMLALLILSGIFVWGCTLFLKPANPLSNSLSNRLLTGIRSGLYPYAWPILYIIALGSISYFWQAMSEFEWLFNLGQSLATLFLLNNFVTRNTTRKLYIRVTRFILLPICFSYFMGWLDDISRFLASFVFSVGNIHITLNDVARTFLFGVLLFWLGKESNNRGKDFIRKRNDLDIRSKEIFAKGFEIMILVLSLVLLLEIAGVDITTLAIMGGAVGVGVGLGLQSIASNFISGIIVLLDRSISVGDHIQFEDGQQGTVTELNLRCATIETYEGKDILIPNERFITSSFVNWTHKNQQQRYSLNLQVAYTTDLHALFALLRDIVASHPKVLSGEDYPLELQPDAEIAGFGESGVDILIEFWMEGIDDGKNRVGADLLLMIWDAFQAHNIVIPFPQRDVRVINDNLCSTSTVAS